MQYLIAILIQFIGMCFGEVRQYQKWWYLADHRQSKEFSVEDSFDIMYQTNSSAAGTVLDKLSFVREMAAGLSRNCWRGLTVLSKDTRPFDCCRNRPCDLPVMGGVTRCPTHLL